MNLPFTVHDHAHSSFNEFWHWNFDSICRRMAEVLLRVQTSLFTQDCSSLPVLLELYRRRIVERVE